MFSDWLSLANCREKHPTAMILSTTSGRVPYSRTVLLKKHKGNEFTFFTNYESPKSSDMEFNPYVSLLFFWPEIERQVRIVGTVKKTSREESVEYFNTRPYYSRVASCVSKQSAVLKSTARFWREFGRFSVLERADCPEHWGGWIVTAEEMEFLEMKPSRAHIRDHFHTENGEWKHVILYP